MLSYKECGEHHLFDCLYRRHRKLLFNFLLRQCPKASAEEVFQETWTAVIRHRRAYQQKGKFKNWLFNIAHNKLMDMHRKQQSRMTLSPTEGETNSESVAEPQVAESSVIDEIDRERNAERLNNIVGALPFHQKEALLLKQQGFTLDEIAEIAGTNFETVKSRLRYAFKKLREEWEVCHAE